MPTVLIAWPTDCYCYAELAVSFLAVAVTIASTRLISPTYGGKTSLSWSG